MKYSILYKTLFTALRFGFSPLALLYALILKLRNLLFDVGIFNQTSFDVPIIVVGNLSVGGTGKTPQIEYLIRLLEDQYTIAVLSRGYKRKSKGFVVANAQSTVEDLGDEPLQFFKKFKGIKVAVDADRRNGIQQLLKLHPSISLILLDDAFQHRKVKAKFNILLTSYDSMYTNDFVLPLGNLRETRSGASRAKVVIVTKCPEKISFEERQKISFEINPKKYQQVFFSTICYDDAIQSYRKSISIKTLKEYEVVLVTGIAKPKPLLDFLSLNSITSTHLEFPDHHNFTKSDIDEIRTAYEQKESDQKIILTTEKDFMRLSMHIGGVFYIGIRTSIFENNRFDTSIRNSV